MSGAGLITIGVLLLIDFRVAGALMILFGLFRALTTFPLQGK